MLQLIFLLLSISVVYAQVGPLPGFVPSLPFLRFQSSIGTPQTIGTNSSSVSSSVIALTTTSSIANGDLVFVCLFNDTSAVTVSSLSDGTNTYVQAGPYLQISAPSILLSIWYKQNAAAVGSGASLTATFSGSVTDRVISAFHVSGIQTSGSLDTVTSSTQSFASTASATMNNILLTPSANNELVATCNTTFTTGASPPVTAYKGDSAHVFSNVSSSIVIGNNVGFAIDQNVASTVNSEFYEPTWNYGNTNGTKWIGALMAAFKGR